MYVGGMRSAAMSAPLLWSLLLLLLSVLAASPVLGHALLRAATKSCAVPCKPQQRVDFATDATCATPTPQAWSGEHGSACHLAGFYCCCEIPPLGDTRTRGCFTLPAAGHSAGATATPRPIDLSEGMPSELLSLRTSRGGAGGGGAGGNMLKQVLKTKTLQKQVILEPGAQIPGLGGRGLHPLAAAAQDEVVQFDELDLSGQPFDITRLPHAGMHSQFKTIYQLDAAIDHNGNPISSGDGNGNGNNGAGGGAIGGGPIGSGGVGGGISGIGIGGGNSGVGIAAAPAAGSSTHRGRRLLLVFKDDKDGKAAEREHALLEQVRRAGIAAVPSAVVAYQRSGAMGQALLELQLEGTFVDIFKSEPRVVIQILGTLLTGGQVATGEVIFVKKRGDQPVDTAAATRLLKSLRRLRTIEIGDLQGVILQGGKYSGHFVVIDPNAVGPPGTLKPSEQLQYHAALDAITGWLEALLAAQHVTIPT